MCVQILTTNGHQASTRAGHAQQLISMADNRTEGLRILLAAYIRQFRPPLKLSLLSGRPRRSMGEALMQVDSVPPGS